MAKWQPLHIKLWASTSDRMMPLCFPSWNGNRPRAKTTLTISALSKIPFGSVWAFCWQEASPDSTQSLPHHPPFGDLIDTVAKHFTHHSQIKQQNALAQCKSFSCISIQKSTFTRKMHAANAIGDVLLRPCFVLRPQPCWVCLHPQPWHKSAWQGTTSGNSKHADAGKFRERHRMGKVEVEVPSTAASSMTGIECSQVSPKST